MNNCVYEYQNGLYINLTNRCSNSCTFCERQNNDGIGNTVLWLKNEPSYDELIARLNNFDYDEVVFCGFGEPTQRLDVLLLVAQHLKSIGKKTRLNTNGQGSLINGRDICADLKKCIDTVSISLNHCNALDYQRLCKSVFGEKAFDAVLEFARGCVQQKIKTILSVVDIIDAQSIERCAELAKAVGAEFRVRSKY